MKIRHAAIGVATLLALTVGLPALGGPIPDIYRVNWGVDGDAYASAEGACGFVDTAVLGGTRQQAFCFGDTVEVRSGPGGGQIARVRLWVSDTTCTGTPPEQQCDGRSWTLAPPEVTYSIDPALGEARVPASGQLNLEGCGIVQLSLASNAEPNLATNAPLVEAGAGLNRVDVFVSVPDTSVGRNASVSGQLCGVTVTAANSTGGRIFRGLGSERGVAASVRYESS